MAFFKKVAYVGYCCFVKTGSLPLAICAVRWYSKLREFVQTSLAFSMILWAKTRLFDKTHARYAEMAVLDFISLCHIRIFEAIFGAKTIALF